MWHEILRGRLRSSGVRLEMTQISLNFTYTKTDYTRAYRLHAKNSIRLIRDCIVFLILSAIVYCFLRERIDIVPFMIFSAIFYPIFMWVMTCFIVPARGYSKSPQLHQPHQFNFSEQDIAVKTGSIDAHLQWSIYTKFIEDQYSYLLYQGGNMFTIIPKRVFPSAELRSDFEQLLKEKIPV